MSMKIETTIGSIIDFEPDTSHYLANVMRLKEGSHFRAFNETGEYLMEMIRAPQTRRVHGRPSKYGARTEKVYANVLEVLRNGDNNNNEVVPTVLYFATLKKAKMKGMLTKLTELGASFIHPIITENTQGHGARGNEVGLSYESLSSCILEAVEQSERLTLPSLAKDPVPLQIILTQWQERSEVEPDANVKLFVCKERSDDDHVHTDNCMPLLSALLDNTSKNMEENNVNSCLLHALTQYRYNPSEFTADFNNTSSIHEKERNRQSTENYLPPVGIVVGPEGGFTKTELEMASKYSCVQFVSLGQNVLRAETASVCALTIVKAALEHTKHTYTKSSE